MRQLGFGTGEKIKYTPYSLGKATHLPFYSSNRKTHNPLEIVHTDIVGPITPMSVGGKSYFITFIDDYTHLTTMYTLRTHSRQEVFECFKGYLA